MSERIGALWGFPVKSMQGQSVRAATLGDAGVVGDRAYGFLDVEKERLVSCKRPKLYPGLFDCRAEFVGEPVAGEVPPPVRVTLPDGTVVEGDDESLARAVGGLVGRELRLARTIPPGMAFEEDWV